MKKSEKCIILQKAVVIYLKKLHNTSKLCYINYCCILILKSFNFTRTSLADVEYRLISIINNP